MFPAVTINGVKAAANGCRFPAKYGVRRLYYSKYNLVLPLQDSVYKYAVLNSLSGAFDLATEKEGELLSAYSQTQEDTSSGLSAYLKARGYLFESQAEEDALVERKFAEFQDVLQESAPQVLLIPTYNCNLACVYCFQNGIKDKTALITPDVVDAFFAILPEIYPFQKPFITLFGGEPLVYSPKQSEIIAYIVDKAAELDYEIAAVTNGYDLVQYLDVLTKAKVREIQVTIDGPQNLHDARRHTKNGKGTFDQIMQGLTEAISLGIPINLRAVVDKTNFAGLVDLANELEQRGWLDLPPEKFKTQIGRNYELFECYATPKHLLDQVEHWAKVVELSEQYPVLKKFHQPEFKGIKHLVQTGELYLPTFDTCPACKTEWVFDLYGQIYGCTANTGREEYSLGTFYPQLQLNSSEIGEWQKRNVLNIPECRDCDVSLICGGGCGVVAKEKNGSVLSPDCRPIKGILEQGLKYFQSDILAMQETSSS